MKKIIAVDIDDVLAESTDLIRLTSNELAGVNLEKHHYKVPGPYWSYYEHVLEANGVTDTRLHKSIMENWISNHGKANPIQGAVDALLKLSQKYRIILITARDPKIRTDTEEWVKTHFAGLYDELHVIGNFKVVDNPKSKGQICAEVGAEWLVDDNPEHCLSAIEHGIDAVLFGEYGWHFDAPENLVRCKNWDEILGYFDGQSI